MGKRNHMMITKQSKDSIHLDIKCKGDDMLDCQDATTTNRSFDGKLLVVCHSYNTFQKESIEALSGYFKEINVLVRTNRFAEISNYFPIEKLARLKRSYKIDLTQMPSNIGVNSTPIWYFPTDRSYKSIGEKHYLAAEKVIDQHHLKFDLVHSHFTWSAGYVGARLKNRYGVPFVITAHGYDVYSLPFRDDEWKRKIEFVLNEADAIITVSKSNQECIKKLGVSRPVSVVPNGFNSKMFYPRDTIECRNVLGLPLNKKILLAVGNLVPVKGHRYLIDAIKTIVMERKDILCIIVGMGSLHAALERQIRSLGLEDYVILTGAKPHNEIPIWMNACDLFILPSLNEGNPTVMFEALGCGKPFIGTKVGGVPEIVKNGEYGLLVEQANSHQLAEKIVEGLHREWNQITILTYANQYCWENISKKIGKIYADMLE